MLTPRNGRAGPVPWVWYAPTLLPGQTSALPDISTPSGAEVWMFERFLEAGVAVAGIDAGESYGSPAGQRQPRAVLVDTFRRHLAYFICNSPYKII